MKKLPVLFVAVFLLMWTSACIADVDPQPEPAPAPEPVKLYTWWSGEELIREAGDWKLVVAYLQKGTRSEGQDGKLYKSGMVVEAVTEPLETPLGRLKHYGDERQRPWDFTGWNLADRSAAKPSAHIEVTGPPPAAATRVAIPMEGGTQTVRVTEGGTLGVELTGQPSTGHRWTLEEERGQTLLVPAGEPERRPSDFKGPGAPEFVLYRFRAVQAGDAQLRFTYRRPWEKDKAPSRTAVVQVTIDGKPPALTATQEEAP